MNNIFMSTAYNSKPIDTTDVELSEELMQLVELLVENNYDVRAKGRMDEGWVYGFVRNDELKQPPALSHTSNFPIAKRNMNVSALWRR